MGIVEGAGGVFPNRRPHRSAEMAWRQGPSGVRERGKHDRGVLQEPGRSDRFRVMSPGWEPGDQAQVDRGGSTRAAPRKPSLNAVPPNEGNEVRRDERPDVGASHSTEEAGERTRRTPSREGEAGLRKRLRERCEGHRAHKASQRDLNG